MSWPCRTLSMYRFVPSQTIYRILILTALCASLPVNAALAQLPGLPSTNQQPAAPAANDALGRETPLGTVTGLSAPVHRGDLEVAIRYLETRGRSNTDLENLATQLNDLLDRYFTSLLTSLSMQPGGVLDDGLAPNRERLWLTIGDRREELYLVRASEAGGPPIWLFSSGSLGRGPAPAAPPPGARGGKNMAPARVSPRGLPTCRPPRGGLGRPVGG